MTLLSMSVMASASSAEGVWATEANDSGGHLEITIAPCASDAKKTCGIITNAITPSGPDAEYKNLGKLMIDGMTSKDGVHYSGGTIWDPEKDKIYKSKLEVKGNDLDVEGCISFVCIGEDWKRVK
jgi:uncharacterized protein (DUF2147 family)